MVRPGPLPVHARSPRRGRFHLPFAGLFTTCAAPRPSELRDDLRPDRDHSDEQRDRRQGGGFFDKQPQHGGSPDWPDLPRGKPKSARQGTYEEHCSFFVLFVKMRQWASLKNASEINRLVNDLETTALGSGCGAAQSGTVEIVSNRAAVWGPGATGAWRLCCRLRTDPFRRLPNLPMTLAKPCLFPTTRSPPALHYARIAIYIEFVRFMPCLFESACGPPSLRHRRDWIKPHDGHAVRVFAPRRR